MIQPILFELNFQISYLITAVVRNVRVAIFVGLHYYFFLLDYVCVYRLRPVSGAYDHTSIRALVV